MHRESRAHAWAPSDPATESRRELPSTKAHRPRSRSRSQGPRAARASGPVRWQFSGSMLWVEAGTVRRERTHRDAGNCNELFNKVRKNKRILSGVAFSHWMGKEVLVSSTLFCTTDLLHTSRALPVCREKGRKGLGNWKGPQQPSSRVHRPGCPDSTCPLPTSGPQGSAQGSPYWAPSPNETIPHGTPAIQTASGSRQAGTSLECGKRTLALGESHCPH